MGRKSPVHLKIGHWSDRVRTGTQMKHKQQGGVAICTIMKRDIKLLLPSEILFSLNNPGISRTEVDEGLQ